MNKRSQTGFTLIELIIFIVIVSSALAGVLLVLNVTTQHSADPMIRKNMLAIAESLLEEVQLQPFTWCDPNDPQAATAVSAAVGLTGCTSVAYVEASGPETSPAETRTSTTAPFDNVNDYAGLDNITTNITGAGMTSGYSASIAVAAADLNGITLASGASLLITVVVCHASTCNQSSGGDVITLQGYRTRYSPNTLP